MMNTQLVTALKIFVVALAIIAVLTITTLFATAALAMKAGFAVDFNWLDSDFVFTVGSYDLETLFKLAFASMFSIPFAIRFANQMDMDND